MSKLIRWNPVRESLATSRAMDRMMNDLWQSFSMDTSRPFAAPALDVIDRENEVEVQINLPGVKPEDVDIEVKDGILTIATKVNTDETHENARYTYRERYTGSFQRSLRVPETIDVEKADATFENGVLTLTLPKKPEAQPIRIPIGSNGKQHELSSGEK